MVNNNIAIVQVRETSNRFFRKCLKKIKGKTIISILFDRLKKSKYLDDIIFSIPFNKKNLKLYKHLKVLNVEIFRGNENNVLSRIYKTAKKYKAKNIIRVTGDCPLIDPLIIDKMIHKFKNDRVDYFSNIIQPTFPDGFDIEIMKFSALELSYKNAKTKFDKEHVTTYIRQSDKFKKKNFSYSKNYSNYKLSLDTKKDLVTLKKIFKIFNYNFDVSLQQILHNRKVSKIFSKSNKIKIKNIQIKKLWKKAKKVIAGGNMLLSKNPEIILPEMWPTYYKYANGCTIVDMNNNKFTDLFLMGVGTNILGYSNKKVDESVQKAIQKGNMSSLNCFEEVKLAEKLVSMHPGLELVKFARTGGEANAMSVRIARAASGKDKIAICGYHGWHDWYLAANFNRNNKNLDKHLIKGLKIGGVPSSLKNTVFPFEYGNYKQLENILKTNSLGAIKMEICRNTLPDTKFLKYIRDICNKKNIVLIFDECTTGFRETFGGLYKKIKIKPDILILGKALGNGYAITSVLGKREIMSYAQESFISSTFWTERSGYVAALKTLEIMEELKSWQTISKIGKKIQSFWSDLFNYYTIDFKINGIPALTNFVLKNNHDKYKTFITQEMLKYRILAGTSIYPSVSHTDRILNIYFDRFEGIVKKIKQCELGMDIDKLLETRVPKKNFQRLN